MLTDDLRHLERVLVELDDLCGDLELKRGRRRGVVPLPRTNTRRWSSSGSSPSSSDERLIALNWCDPASSCRNEVTFPLIGCISPTAAISCSPAMRRSGRSASRTLLGL
jgi:hypothetical protein